MSKNFLLVSLNDKKARKLASAIKNPSCRKILDFLATKEDVTETQISKETKIPLSTVHYSMKQLIETKLVKSDEYQQFTNKTYQEITNRILTIFNLSNKKIEQLVLYQMYTMFRANKYSINVLDNYLRERKQYFETEIIYLTNNLFHNKYKDNLQFIKNNWLLTYINCNFSMKELEFEIVLSDSYYQFANQKLLELV